MTCPAAKMFWLYFMELSCCPFLYGVNSYVENSIHYIITSPYYVQWLTNHFSRTINRMPGDMFSQ